MTRPTAIQWLALIALAVVVVLLVVLVAIGNGVRWSIDELKRAVDRLHLVLGVQKVER